MRLLRGGGWAGGDGCKLGAGGAGWVQPRQLRLFARAVWLASQWLVIQCRSLGVGGVVRLEQGLLGCDEISAKMNPAYFESLRLD
jgi:hypothetical protein